MLETSKLAIAIILTLCTPGIAVVDTYDDSIETQLAEFQIRP